MAITAKEVEKLSKKPGRHGCGQGLYLEVDRKGRCSWVYIYTRSGRRREMGLGSATGANATILAQARDKRDAARGLLAQGIDPLDAKREAERREAPATPTEGAPESKTLTFGAFVDRYIADNEAGWRNAKHRAQWKMTLGRARDDHGNLTGKGYCLTLANKPVDAITVEDVRAEIAPLWVSKPETARRIRGRVEMVLDAAKVLGHRSGPNPALWKGSLEHLLPKRKKLSRGHHAAMPYNQLPGFMVALRASGAMGARALEFAILCASRSGEVRLAPWREINLAERVWTIPPGRMKADAEHRVPLTDRAIEILEEVSPLRPEHDDGSSLIFPGAGGKPLSDMTLAAVMKRLGAAYTPHGTARSSFRDWAGDCTHHSREAAEACLAHTLQGVEAAYRRSDAFAKRRALLTEWAAYLDGKLVQDTPAANVRPFPVLRSLPTMKAANAA